MVDDEGMMKPLLNRIKVLPPLENKVRILLVASSFATKQYKIKEISAHFSQTEQVYFECDIR